MVNPTDMNSQTAQLSLSDQQRIGWPWSGYFGPSQEPEISGPKKEPKKPTDSQNTFTNPELEIFHGDGGWAFSSAINNKYGYQLVSNYQGDVSQYFAKQSLVLDNYLSHYRPWVLKRFFKTHPVVMSCYRETPDSAVDNDFLQSKSEKLIEHLNTNGYMDRNTAEEFVWNTASTFEFNLLKAEKGADGRAKVSKSNMQWSYATGGGDNP